MINNISMFPSEFKLLKLYVTKYTFIKYSFLPRSNDSCVFRKKIWILELQNNLANVDCFSTNIKNSGKKGRIYDIELILIIVNIILLDLRHWYRLRKWFSIKELTMFWSKLAILLSKRNLKIISSAFCILLIWN